MVYHSLVDGVLTAESFARLALGHLRSGVLTTPAPRSRASISPFPARTCNQAKRTQNSANMQEADRDLSRYCVVKNAERGVREMLVL